MTHYDDGILRTTVLLASSHVSVLLFGGQFSVGEWDGSLGFDLVNSSHRKDVSDEGRVCLCIIIMRSRVSQMLGKRYEFVLSGLLSGIATLDVMIREN